jgi:predicted nucleic acid-binding protein
MLVYCDSVILIYLLDTVGSFNLQAINHLNALRARGDHIAVRELTRLECRVKPIRLNDPLRLARFDGFFALPDVHHLPLTPAVYERATLIRAAHRFDTLDAIHLAAAVEGGCDGFLTNDRRLTSFPDITIELLP